MTEKNKTNDTASDKIRFAGDVNIENVTITSLISGVTFNVANQLATIQVFEDLFSPFITGSLIFQEALDFANKFPFVGEEILDLRIFTPTFDAENPEGRIIEGKFYIYKMADRAELSDKLITYQLHFISIEAVTDANTKISKSFSGKPSDIAKLLVTSEEHLGTKKNLLVEESGNSLRYVSNFWSPVRNLNYLSSWGTNQKNMPTYLFFENRTGFNFVTLDYLNGGELKQQFIYGNSQDAVFSSGGSTRVIDNDYKRISDLKVPVTNDYLSNLGAGTYGSTKLYSTLTTKRYFNQKFSMFDDWGKDAEVRLNAHPIASNKISVTHRGKIYANGNTNKNLSRRLSRLTQAEAFKIEIVVPGRTDYTVGQIVSVKSFLMEPIYKSDTEYEEKDNLVSGSYLVAAINHVIDRNKHECWMELVKDSLNIDLDKGGK